MGGLQIKKEEQRNRLGRHGKREAKRALIYEACIGDNQKVKGYRRGLKGGKTKTE